MIKRLFLITFAFGFAFLVLGISVVKASAQSNILRDGTSAAVLVDDEEVDLDENLADEAEEGMESEEATTEAQEEITESVNYQLPYPGRILPDHPLYFLKMIRDRIWLFFTTNSLKKAEEFAKIYELEVVMVPTNEPMIRKDMPDSIYKTETGKFKAVGIATVIFV